MRDFELFFLVAFTMLGLVSNSSIIYQSCPPAYFFDLQHCQACASNCICNSIKGCTSCIQGYTMYNGNCIQCPQSSGIYGTCSNCCSKTTGTILSCTDCAIVPNAYSFLYSGRCIVSPGCYEIDSNGFCNQCLPGFYQWNNLCYACHASCSTCTDATNCLSCSPGYYWGTTNGGRCKSCPSGCSNCDSTGKCYGCLNYYYLFSDHCLNCPAYCTKCSDGSTCTQCSQGILVSNLCIMCTDATYGGSVGCSSCIASNNFITCNQCADTYFLDTNGVCQSCASFISGALRCRDKNTPTQCLNDYHATLTNRYYLVGITCIANTKSCRKISDIYGNCSQCYQGYILTNGACQLCPFTGCLSQNSTIYMNACNCTACSSGYYLPALSAVCSPCSTTNCATCPSNTCTSCVTGYHLSVTNCIANALTNCLVSSTSVACSICNDGYFKGSDNLCYNCQSTCLTCTSRTVCTSCAANYYLHSSHSCVAKPSNCIAQAVDFSCSLCAYGYYLNNGYCLPCNVQLGTLNKCQGLCPIDYYIQTLIVVNYDQLITVLVILMAFLMI